jgi:hypothetical protein
MAISPGWPGDLVAVVVEQLHPGVGQGHADRAAVFGRLAGLPLAVGEVSLRP